MSVKTHSKTHLWCARNGQCN